MPTAVGFGFSAIIFLIIQTFNFATAQRSSSTKHIWNMSTICVVWPNLIYIMCESFESSRIIYRVVFLCSIRSLTLYVFGCVVKGFQHSVSARMMENKKAAKSTFIQTWRTYDVLRWNQTRQTKNGFQVPRLHRSIVHFHRLYRLYSFIFNWTQTSDINDHFLRSLSVQMAFNWGKNHANIHNTHGQR